MPGGLDWVVAVERPRASALAGVRRGRDMAFALLLLVVPLAVIGGIIVARLIARPLGTLADAVSEMAGNPSAPGVPLDIGDITEVAGLATAFQEMRDRLAVRTRESERLATELRARADAILIAPNDRVAMISPLRDAKDAGIAIFTVDTFIEDDSIAIANIASDNVLGGQVLFRQKAFEQR